VFDRGGEGNDRIEVVVDVMAKFALVGVDMLLRVLPLQLFILARSSLDFLHMCSSNLTEPRKTEFGRYHG